MTIREAYTKYDILVNRSATNNKVAVDFGRFIISFNKEQINYLKNTLERRNEDDIRNVQVCLVLDSQLTFTNSTDIFDRYALPGNYFDFKNLRVKVSTDCCKDADMTVFEMKMEDEQELLADPDNRPSFEYRETFYTMSSGQMVIWKPEDTAITSVKLSYYRYPAQVDIAGYIRTDGSTSTADVDPEFDDKVVNKILLMMAKEFSADTGDAESYNLNQNRLNSPTGT